MVKLLQSNLVAAVLGVVLYFTTTAMLMSNLPKVKPKAREIDPASIPNIRGPSWDFHNPEMDQAVEELKKERHELATREKLMKELEARVLAERAELDEATRAIKKLQADLDRDIVKVKEDEAGNLKKLARMYASMEPPGAANILRELDDPVLVKILTLMKEAETAPILDALARRGEVDTKRAARLSEYLRLASTNKTPVKK